MIGKRGGGRAEVMLKMGKRNSSVDVACLAAPSKNLSRDLGKSDQGSTPKVVRAFQCLYKTENHIRVMGMLYIAMQSEPRYDVLSLGNSSHDFFRLYDSSLEPYACDLWAHEWIGHAKQLHVIKVFHPIVNINTLATSRRANMGTMHLCDSISLNPRFKKNYKRPVPGATW